VPLRSMRRQAALCWRLAQWRRIAQRASLGAKASQHRSLCILRVRQPRQVVDSERVGTQIEQQMDRTVQICDNQVLRRAQGSPVLGYVLLVR